jgi:hypothetical protein
MRCRPATFRQKGINAGPVGEAGFLLVLGQRGQHGRVAQAGQVGVGFPVLERLCDELSYVRRTAFQDLRPRGQVVIEPVNCLLQRVRLFSLG